MIQCHHEVLPLYFYYYVSIIFSALLIIQKQQKHANNKKTRKYFHKQTLILNQVIVFLFYFIFLNQTLINLNFIMSSLSLILKNTNKFSFATWFFILKPFFQKLIKNTKSIKRQFLPRTTRF